MLLRQLLLISIILFSYFCLSAQISAPIDVTRLPSELNFDGKVDEDFWPSIPTIPVLQNIPNFMQEGTEKTEMRLTYDDNYLYLSGINRLSDPKLLRNTTLKRDIFDATTDYYGLVIDSYNDKENAVAFFIGPTGFRWDGTVSNDAQSDNDVSVNWNSFWDAKTTVSDSMWTCEIRIPWTSLRFQEIDNSVIMGMTFWWYIAGKNELLIYPYISNEQGQSSQWKSSLMQEFRFENISEKKPVYFSPYVLTGFQRTAELNDPETEYIIENNPVYEAGLDIKYSVTSNLTMDLTINTDFAQVEADDQQVNLTRFSLFFPEKRLFFQERASVFNFSFDGFNRLFHSRKIGIDEDGNPLRIYGGARLVGRIGKSDFGFLNMQADGEEDLSSENFTVLRLRRQLINQNSNAGLMLTNRSDLDGTYNRTFGVDASFRLFGFDYLTAKLAQSFENDLENKALSLKSSRIFLDWERRKLDGLIYKLSYSRIGDDFSPGIGFELRENTSSLSTIFGLGGIPGENSKLQSWKVIMDASGFVNNSSDSLETLRIAPNFQFVAKNGVFGATTLSFNHEFVSEAFDLSDDIEITKGTYDFWQFNTVISTPFQNFVGALFDITIGEFYGGEYLALGLSPRWRINKHLGLDGVYQFNRANFTERNQLFTAHIGRLKAEYLFNTKVSLSAFLQYNSLDDLFSGNVRFRVNPREGVDFYLVYNDNINNNRMREIPHLPYSESRTLALKFTYTHITGS